MLSYWMLWSTEQVGWARSVEKILHASSLLFLSAVDASCCILDNVLAVHVVHKSSFGLGVNHVTLYALLLRAAESQVFLLHFVRKQYWTSTRVGGDVLSECC